MAKRHLGGKIRGNWKYGFAGLVACATITAFSYYSVRSMLTSKALTESVEEIPITEVMPEVQEEVEPIVAAAPTTPFIQQIPTKRQHIELWNRLYVATMMSHEACEEVCAKREAIGFMNRIDHPYTGCHTPREVFYSGAYAGCENGIPDETTFEWATEVIEAYNSDYWEEYCASFGLTNRVIFHHNGVEAKSFEHPRYTEYGCSQYGYKWTMLYSEHVDYHY